MVCAISDVECHAPAGQAANREPRKQEGSSVALLPQAGEGSVKRPDTVKRRASLGAEQAQSEPSVHTLAY